MQWIAANLRNCLTLGLLLTSMAFLVSAEQRPAIPDELVQYVRSARKAGSTETQILKTAVGRGWSEASVKSALELTKKGSKGKASRPEQVAASTAPAGALPADIAPSGRGEATTNAGGGGAPVLAGQPANLTAPTPPPVGGRITKGPAKGSAAAANVPYNYQIGEGDVLEVSVYGEPSVSVHAVVVRPDGKISVPLLGDVAAAGLTPTQLSNSVSQKLSDLIKTADVTIVVGQINSKKIYLIGGVKREGPIPYTYQMTIMQALSEAGGLTEYAKRKKIYVLRTKDGQRSQLHFNYDSVLKGEHTEMNVDLLPGDTLVVPQ